VKVAFFHDWLNGMRGGEKCLDSLLREYPEGEIYTLVHEPGAVSSRIESRPVVTSALQRLPGGRRFYKAFLPFLPRLARSVRARPCDLVISTHHCVAKGFRKPAPGVPHLCYCFTPMRYAWLFFDEYFGNFPAPLKAPLKRFLGSLRRWDLSTNGGVTHFVAISEHIRDRIRRFYGRDAAVIYPPVDTDFYRPAAGPPREDFYLLVSALVPYKRPDLAVRALNELGQPLVVIGRGPEEKRLRRMAKPNVRFLGGASNETIRDHYRRCRALLFPGEEDFGIVPVEAQACGAPVVAFGRGGALETVRAGRTGVFFFEQSVESLLQALKKERLILWDPELIREQAEKFNEPRFREEFRRFVREQVLGAAAAPAEPVAEAQGRTAGPSG